MPYTQTRSLWWVLTHLWRFRADEREIFIFTPLFVLHISDWGPDWMTYAFQHGWKLSLFMKWNQQFEAGRAIDFMYSWESMKRVTREYWENSGCPWPPA